ncbi:MAG: proline racemase family protein [Pseudomonadota bacterium]|nr:proline racemase family protein [Pseudomonadota bacterium]MBU1570264.1 proline racemase family protein [Pseudomonadota bacterium]
MIEFEHLITAIDTHTEGQATRIVINGLPVIAGGSMAEKFTFLKQSPIHNRLREALMREPRGHRGMFGAFLTPPCGRVGDVHQNISRVCEPIEMLTYFLIIKRCFGSKELTCAEKLSN